MICIPVMAKDTSEALVKIARANALADILELRLDVMETFDLRRMIQAARRPVILTYRSKGEGGKGSADDTIRGRHVLDAAAAGADFVDVEYSLAPAHRSDILKHLDPSKVIISTHITEGTPPAPRLEKQLEELVETGAGIVKMVTFARAPEDNLRVLNLIPRARDSGVPMIAFCMGRAGRISRLASPLLGGYLTFAALEEGEESADGQIPAKEMKRILETLKA